MRCTSLRVAYPTPMQDVDAEVRAALLDFSLHLATGCLDEAFRAVRAIRQPGVWAAMAHTAIKCKRLDVAGAVGPWGGVPMVTGRGCRGMHAAWGARAAVVQEPVRQQTLAAAPVGKALPRMV